MRKFLLITLAFAGMGLLQAGAQELEGSMPVDNASSLSKIDGTEETVAGDTAAYVVESDVIVDNASRNAAPSLSSASLAAPELIEAI